jgi:hypothetical protein
MVIKGECIFILSLQLIQVPHPLFFHLNFLLMAKVIIEVHSTCQFRFEHFAFFERTIRKQVSVQGGHFIEQLILGQNIVHVHLIIIMGQIP